MTDERRREQRHALELPMELFAGGGMVLLKSHDLSVGGAFFDSAIPHAPGTRVKVRFTLPGDDRPVECDAEVVTTRGDKLGMGVKFVDLSRDDARKLSRFAASLAAPAGAKGSKQ